MTNPLDRFLETWREAAAHERGLRTLSAALAPVAREMREEQALADQTASELARLLTTVAPRCAVSAEFLLECAAEGAMRLGMLGARGATPSVLLRAAYDAAAAGESLRSVMMTLLATRRDEVIA